MGQRITLLNEATAVANGNAVAVGGSNVTAGFQAVLTGTSANQDLSATVAVQVSLDGTHYDTLYTFSLAVTDWDDTTENVSQSLTVSVPYAHVRGAVTAISGTGATASLFMGV